jgi:hypothetical protein
VATGIRTALAQANEVGGAFVRWGPMLARAPAPAAANASIRLCGPLAACRAPAAPRVHDALHGQHSASRDQTSATPRLTASAPAAPLGRPPQALDKLEAAAAVPTYDGIIGPLERITDKLELTWGVVTHLRVREGGGPQGRGRGLEPAARQGFIYLHARRGGKGGMAFTYSLSTCFGPAALRPEQPGAAALHKTSPTPPPPPAATKHPPLPPSQSVRDSPELRKAIAEVQPEVVTLELRLGQSRPLYEALTAVKSDAGWANLTPTQQVRGRGGAGGVI